MKILYYDKYDLFFYFSLFDKLNNMSESIKLRNRFELLDPSAEKIVKEIVKKVVPVIKKVNKNIPDTVGVVYNKCYGGFELSDEGLKLYNQLRAENKLKPFIPST